MNTLALISLFICAVAIVNGQACGPSGGCGGGMCCSKWGYCGNSNDHCGDGCQSGSCKGATPPPSNGGQGLRCGVDWSAAICSNRGCSNNGDCPAGQSCFKDLPACGGSPPSNPPSNPPPSNNGGTTRCGTNWGTANDGCSNKGCSNNGDCPGGQSCFKDLKPCGSGPNPPSNPPSNPPPSGSGSITSLINKNDFDRALGACGIQNKPNLYNDLIRGFTAPLPGGIKELALLMGNMAHESGYFNFVEEIKCAGVNHVTAECPYGLYHGRGYIQLSWDYNYRDAANYLNNQAVFNNPDIVMHDPVVNWQTVQFFWVTRVQDTFRKSGYTMGASVRAINGGIECDWGTISPQRVNLIQCFERQYGTPVDTSTACPARAVGDQQSVFSEDNLPQSQQQSQQLPSTFVIALVVLGTITLVLGVVVVVIMVILGKRMRSQEHV